MKKGFVIAETFMGNALTPVEIVKMDDGIESNVVGGREFVGNGDSEVLVHFVYLNRPDQWLPSDTVCLKLSDIEAENRVYSAYSESEKRDHNITCVPSF